MKFGQGIGGLGAVYLLSGCLQGDFVKYRPDAEFIDLYAELKLASLTVNQDLDKVSEIRRVILAQHGMTPAEFHEHFMQLSDHPEAWRPFQEQVVARIDAFQNKPAKKPEGDAHGK
jgi:hypothetical protein